MKLFLRFQVEKRALEIWGDEETLEEEHRKREEKRDQAKVKKFNKKLKALRMQVRFHILFNVFVYCLSF